MMSHSAFISPPPQFSKAIVEPAWFERHEDKPARALKIKGFHQGQSCFYFHTYSIVEQRFDCDDCAYELITYFERAIAWKLNNGRWLQQKFQAHHPVCSPENQMLQDFEIVEVCAWVDGHSIPDRSEARKGRKADTLPAKNPSVLSGSEIRRKRPGLHSMP